MVGLVEEIFEKFHFQPYVWLRYLDCIFCIWNKGPKNLKEFFQFLNNFHLSIKFTIEYSQKLNTKLTSSLITSLFTKSTDKHQHLHVTSCHKSVYKKSIRYGQIIRIKRVCSIEVGLQRKLLDLESWLIDRGYKCEIIRLEIQKVNFINSHLKKCSKHQEDSITLVLAFHSALHIVFDVLKQTHRHEQNSTLLKVVLPKPARIAFLIPHSVLRDKLVRSKLKLTDYAEGGNFPCRRGNCKIFNVVKTSKQFSELLARSLGKFIFI